MIKDPEPRVLPVVATDAGERLDVFLAARCPDLTRSRIQSELAADRVQVDGVTRPKNFRLKAGMEVVFSPADRPALTAEPQDIPLNVLYEDEDVIVVDKQAGLVVHPAPGHPDGTLVNALLHHYDGLAGGDDPLRPGIVHRLDRDTTGLLVVARREQALVALQAQLQERRMGRVYLTLSWGRWGEDAGELRGSIGRHPQRRQRMAVVQRGGREAVTRYGVLEDFGFVQLCRVELETGRTHQIRVHFAHAGHPVVGDPLYGDDKRVRGVHHLDRRQADAMIRGTGRQLLHAAELRFIHPGSGREMTFTSPLPPGMAAVLTGLQADDLPGE